MTVSRASTLFLAFAMPCFVLGLKSYLSDVRIVAWPLEVGGHPAFRDFANLWAGGIAACTGDFNTLLVRALHCANIAKLLGVPETNPMWSYPPTAMLLMMPFALLPYAWACAAWVAAGLAAFITVAVIIADDWRASAKRLAAIALCRGVFLCLTSEQTAFLTSAALVGGLILSPTRPIIAGALLALLAAKPQIALVVPFALLAMGAWRTFLATAVFTVLFVALTVAVLGVVLVVARVFASAETLKRFGERGVSALAAAVTVVPFVTLSVLTYSGVNFSCLTPLLLLVALGAEAHFAPGALRRVFRAAGRPATA